MHLTLERDACHKLQYNQIFSVIALDLLIFTPSLWITLDILLVDYALCVNRKLNVSIERTVHQ